MTKEFTDVGRRIVSRLNSLGIKQAYLCKETGLSSNAISQYCTGKRIPDTTSLYLISTVLKTSMEWLLTGKDTTCEKEICDGVPLSYEEGDFIAMYRLLPDSHRREAFDYVYFKYQREVEQGKGSIYSAYSSESRECQSGPGEGQNAHTDTA